jgi:nucleotide-binding universal stress UspA family protein
MYKTIVVGTDGSDRAGMALRQALALATLTGAMVHVVHVIRLVSMTSAAYGDPGAIVTANEAARESGEHVSAHVHAEAQRQGVAIEMHNVDGDPADMIVKMAESTHADLVVVGNRGMAGVKRFVLGSVPNKVAHHCPCSLLIVDTDGH